MIQGTTSLTFFLPQQTGGIKFSQDPISSINPRSPEGLCSSSHVLQLKLVMEKTPLEAAGGILFDQSKSSVETTIIHQTGEGSGQADCTWICHCQPKLNNCAVKVEIKKYRLL